MAARRPLATRNSRWAMRLAAWLAGHGVRPNLISQISLVFAALAGAAFWLSLGSGAVWLVVAAFGVQLRLLCNLLDGMVAVEGGRAERDGAFWNEVPDRAADILILAGAGCGAGTPALGFAAGALAVSTAYIREFGVAQGLAADFSGPMAKPHRMATMSLGALVAVFVPMLAGVSTLSLALWMIVVGLLVTILRRSRRILIHLQK